MVQSAEQRVRTVNEIRNALTASAACLIDGSCVNVIPPSLGDLNFEDGGEYGTILNGENTEYDLEFDFDLVTPPLPSPSPQNNQLISTETNELTSAASQAVVGAAVPNERDIVLRFEGRGALRTGNAIFGFINGTPRFSTNFFIGSRDLEFVISRTFLELGRTQ